MMLLSSCEYLDVLPPEIAEEDDTMKDKNAVEAYLGSCYQAAQKLPNGYTSYETSTDELVSPEGWGQDMQQAQWNQFSATNAPSYWNDYYDAIGQTNHFLKNLDEIAPVDVTNENRVQYRAEANFLLGYYHMRLLNAYGPIPLVMSYASMNTSASDLPGRSSYDECVDAIVAKFDESLDGLPETRGKDDWVRVTKTVAKAAKSRLLVYAASPMWNGQFPFVGWTNKDGKELVNRQYSAEKWQRALDATLDAISTAEAAGHKLLTREDGIRIAAQKYPNGSYHELLCWVPVDGITNDTTSADFENSRKFLETVLALRYIQNTIPSDGNNETLWAVWSGDFTRRCACLPKHLHPDDNQWGWVAMNPTLYSVENFYTKDGTLIKYDPKFQNDDSWLLASAGIPNEDHKYYNLFQKTKADRKEDVLYTIQHSDVINLCANREPRFYASIMFDGDEAFTLMRGDDPLWVNFKSFNTDGKLEGNADAPAGQGFGTDTRDYPSCGFLTKKWARPEERYARDGSSKSFDVDTKRPFILFRLAELYLNAAECYAALGDNANALRYLNIVRNRAGIRDLTTADLGAQSITEWVRSERFIELWGEGLRYYDVRRWLIAPQRLAADSYEGLDVMGITSDQGKHQEVSFEDFNKRIKMTLVDPKLQWDDRMYLMPVPASDLYANFQMIQAPKY